ncbi:MAG: YqaE/Pmp3 family membrane protein [Anaerolineae bacterium]|nr:YqaE/Pmp3 family membrane protein [Anaerolineae bacterium]
MGCGRAILCIIFPPLAVLDRGCGTVLIVLVLTLAAWVPGVIAALLLNYMAANQPSRS